MLSVVVPALNEESYLPRLLGCLAAQTRPPDEVIVADGGSRDSTRDVALGAGTRVVDGGLPSVGRNAGARAASGGLLLFLDADVAPPPRFIERAEREFLARGLDVATVAPTPVERTVEFVAANLIMAAFMHAVSRVSPHATGSCMLARRAFHERIGGFDEAAVLAEDHAYARAAAAAGHFGVLRSVRIPVSMRRVRRDGRIKLARMSIHSERLAFAGVPVRQTPFPYEFGGFPAPRAPEGRSDPGRFTRTVRTLVRPSTETQTDAIVAQCFALLAGLAVHTALRIGGADGTALITASAVTAVGVVVPALVALGKCRLETRYGPFFMTSVCVPRADIADATGAVVARGGIDEVCELHAIGHLGRMSALRRGGPAGRISLMRDVFDGMRAMLDDLGHPRYAGVRLVTARSDLVGMLVRLGFHEIPVPPRYDLANRLYKPIVLWFVGARVGVDRSAGLRRERMVFLTMDEMRAADLRRRLDQLVAELDRDLEMLRARAERVPLGG